MKDEADEILHDVSTEAAIGATVAFEMARQMSELAENVSKMFRQNEDILGKIQCGVTVLMTFAKKVPVKFVIGTDKAMNVLRDALEECTKEAE